MIFDSLITTHSGITYTASSVEKIYVEQALKLLPTHVLSKIISEGWKIVVYDDVNELIAIDNQLGSGTTGVTEYEMRRVFAKGVVDGRNEIAFKTTLLHELTHVFDCIIDGSYCNWKSEKYYTNELENLITQEGSNFSEYARSDIKEYLSTVVSRYLLNLTDFNTVPLTKAFIEKYCFMCEDSLEQRLRNLENNAVTYIELDNTYNKLKYSKLNKENDKYTIQLPQTSSGGSGTSGNSNVIYDNNVTFSTSVSHFSLNKTTISYITENLDGDTTGTWELKTIMGNSSAVAIQIRTFILNGRDSAVTDFTKLPNVQMRYFDYNGSRNWSSWVDKISSLETRVTALENNSGSGGSSSGGLTRTLIHDYTVTEGTILNITNLDLSSGQITTNSDYDFSSYQATGGSVTPVKKPDVNYLLGSDIPSALQTLNNCYIKDIVDNTFYLNGVTSFEKKGDMSKYGLLVDGITSYLVNNVFENNKTYEIEIYTTQPYYYTGLKLSDCISNFDYNLGYSIGFEQYSTYLSELNFFNGEGINNIKHLIKLYNYTDSFKLELESLYDGITSNTTKFNYKKFEYIYNGNIMSNLCYKHNRNLISKGTTIKIYELGGN